MQNSCNNITVLLVQIHAFVSPMTTSISLNVFANSSVPQGALLESANALGSL